mmetsp:Transcript_24721/g.77719  ORF Transcript_24721/g.77719 Transcript_24721/m.77719 type:complete len:238 (+) Transcript_24721:498-1211(+)
MTSLATSTTMSTGSAALVVRVTRGWPPPSSTTAPTRRPCRTSSRYSPRTTSSGPSGWTLSPPRAVASAAADAARAARAVVEEETASARATSGRRMGGPAAAAAQWRKEEGAAEEVEGARAVARQREMPGTASLRKVLVSFARSSRAANCFPPIGTSPASRAKTSRWHRTAATSDGRDVCATPARGDVTCTEINPSPRICAFTPETPHVDSSARALASPAQAASIFRPGDRATMPPEA